MSDVNGHDFDSSDVSEESSPPPHDGRDIPSAQTRRKQKQKEVIAKLIAEAKALGSISIDLSQKELRKIPDELLELTQLEYLYLEGNNLTCLPDTFFDRLPNLQWLDLRRNYLAALPSTYIGRHRHLRTLLLEGNELRTLPLELGLVATLNGLNISNNPLEFPPQEVIARGSRVILAFFRELLRAKSEGHIPNIPSLDDLKLNGESDDSSEEEWGLGSSFHRKESRGQIPSSKQPSDLKYLRSHSKDSTASGVLKQQTQSMGDFDDLVGPVPSTASLHQPPNYNEKRIIHAEKLRRAGAAGILEKSSGKKSRRKSPGKVQSNKVLQYDKPVSQDRVEQRYIEEKRLARLKELKEKQELVLQRRRDAEVIKEWRDEGRVMQRSKMHEKMIKGGKLDYEEPATQAPFGYETEDLKMPTNKERIAQEVRAKHENIRRALSPASVQKLEEARLKRDHELEQKIKSHMSGMQERRKKPQGTPQEEMLAAQKELQMAERLQEELQQRRKELEYRFTAFTGDPNYTTSPSKPKSYPVKH